MLAVVVPMLRRDGDLSFTDPDAALLNSLSAATIDRRLKGERDRLGWRGRGHTKPRTLLKSEIPVHLSGVERKPTRLSRDRPVSHEVNNSSGEFCFTLTMTRIATCWTLNRSVKNKAALWVLEAIASASSQCSFEILDIDSDNGSAFINARCFARCTTHHITFTRSCAPNKNDGAHVAEKNWTHVRPLVGHLRVGSETVLSVLNQIWYLERRYTNYLFDQQKLIAKQRHDATFTKRYDQAKISYQRAVDYAESTEQSKVTTTGRLASRHRAALL
jgi:hypothetical protein